MTAVEPENARMPEQLELDVPMVLSESLRGEKAKNSFSGRVNSGGMESRDEGLLVLPAVEPSVVSSGTGVEGLEGEGPLAIDSGSYISRFS